MTELFGRCESAALLAVERADAGEFAPLEQVVAAFDGLFGERPIRTASRSPSGC